MKRQTQVSGYLWRMYFVRAFAVFFLLFTAADLTFPQVFCPEELKSLSVAQYSVTEAEETTPAAHLDKSRSDDSERQAPCEDDCCFCCGALVLPAKSFAVTSTAINLRTQSFTTYPGLLPTPPLRDTYRPPRSA